MTLAGMRSEMSLPELYLQQSYSEWLAAEIKAEQDRPS